jgi:hypothetical protein
MGGGLVLTSAALLSVRLLRFGGEQGYFSLGRNFGAANPSREDDIIIVRADLELSHGAI